MLRLKKAKIELRKGEIIIEIPRRKDGKINWLLTKGMTKTINSFDYGKKKFNVLDVYRDGKLTFLAMQYEGEYVGDVDCSLILRGSIGVLIGEIPKTRYKRYYKYNN